MLYFNKMAEKLLTDDTRIDNWGDHLDSEVPMDEMNPHPGVWEEKTDDRDEVHISAENIVLEDHEVVRGEAHTDILEDHEVVRGEAHTDTLESTEVLAVHQSQVNICWIFPHKNSE
jgi:hypothetical protein